MNDERLDVVGVFFSYAKLQKIASKSFEAPTATPILFSFLTIALATTPLSLYSD